MEYIDIHTHTTNLLGKSILNLFPADHPVEIPSGLFSVGIHPWFVGNEYNVQKMNRIRKLAQHPLCVAIGETGLDKLTKADIEVQKTIFCQHMAIAEELEKPLILHCVKAHNEIIKLKKTTGSRVPWIVHGFNANINIARQLITEGFFLSFGKALIYSGSNAQKVLKMVPKQSFFLETDDGDQSIELIYKKAATIRDVSLNYLATTIEMSFNKTFKK
jgi:TatD DNase family protein